LPADIRLNKSDLLLLHELELEQHSIENEKGKYVFVVGLSTSTLAYLRVNEDVLKKNFCFPAAALSAIRIIAMH
jgi:hypothetical protein